MVEDKKAVTETKRGRRYAHREGELRHGKWKPADHMWLVKGYCKENRVKVFSSWDNEKEAKKARWAAKKVKGVVGCSLVRVLMQPYNTYKYEEYEVIYEK